MVATRPAAVLRWLLFAILAGSALLNLGFALAMVVRPDELRYGEALLYDHADRLLRGAPLYQPIDQYPYSVAAYTPVYYALGAGLRALFGPGFITGRLLSFAAGLIALGCVARLTWRRTAAWWPTVTASLLLLALGMVGPIPWSSSFKEDVLGVALCLGAIVVLDWRATSRAVVLAATLAALAILTKQTLFSAALAGAVWLWTTRGPRAAASFSGVVALGVLSVCLAMEVTTHALFENVVIANINPVSWSALTFNLNLLALFQTVPIVGALIAAWPRLTGRAIGCDLLVCIWLAALIPVLGIAKEGADLNYWLLFAAPTAVLAASALWARRARLSGLLLAFGLAINVVVASLVVVTLAVKQPALVRPNAAARQGFESVLQRVRTESAGVIADPLDVAVLTDHAIILEPVLYDLLYLDGRWDPTPVVELICTGQVGLLVLGYPLETAGAEADNKWPRPVLDALRDRMQLEEVVPAGFGQRFIYVLDPTRLARPPCAGGA